MPAIRPPVVDLDRLLKLRLVVGRYGEMDQARWWNTQGVLGALGPAVFARGFPKTHYFVQARAVFAVARSRCQELFDPPGCMTLWSLPAELEDQFEVQWQSWLDQAPVWEPFFRSLQGLSKTDLLSTMEQLGLLSPVQMQAAGKLRRSAEGKAVMLPGVCEPDDETVTLLAAGFARGEAGQPAVPYARLA